MTGKLLISPLSNIVPFTVKAISIIFLFLLSGCATSTADLIEQAQLTGDWSLVDKREEARDRREARRGPSCPSSTMKYCVGSPGRKSCSCVSTSKIQDMMRSMQRNTIGYRRRR